MAKLGKTFVPYAEMDDEQRREFHRLGGIAAQQKNKERRQLKQYLQALLDSKTKSGDIAGDICWKLIQKALEGDTKSFELIRDTIGEKPKEEVQATIEDKVINITLEDEDENE